MPELVALAARSEKGELAAAFGAVRAKLGIVAVLLAVAGVAWSLTARRMAGMDAGPGTDLGAFGWFAGVWAVMMAAMMLPSLAPTAAVHAGLVRGREPSRSLLFAGGYLLVWSAAGVAAYGLFALGKSLFAGDLAWRAGGRWLAVGVLALAALYELTPLKDSCLLACRSPGRFLRETWREGGWGAVALGVRAGGWCLGCSWALMAALFALGVMSLTWMALIATLIALEKLAPWRRAASVVTVAVLLGLAVAIVAAPHAVPALVLQDGSSAAMRS
jgi:predicted metal-binding membrane protein